MGPKNPRTVKKRFLSPQEKRTFSNFKNTRSQKPEFSQEGSFQYNTEILKKSSFCFELLCHDDAHGAKFPISKSTHFFSQDPSG